MKQTTILTTTSLLSIVFMTFHLTDDIVRGFEKGELSNLIAVPIFVIWLYGTLVLTGTAIGVRHHAPRVAPWIGRPIDPLHGEGCRR
jgi:hypothetical protein